MITLKLCSRSNPTYKLIRDRHYVPNHGCIGQQLHYIIYEDEEVVGIISGCSSVYGVKPRDVYFGLTDENKNDALPSIINNCVFRLEKHEPNLATRVLSVWRRQIAADWEKRYGVKVHGFETFVVESEIRTGALYKADNWDFIGYTQGSAKVHSGIQNKHSRSETEKKLIFVKKIKGTSLSTSYTSTWRGINSVDENQLTLF